MCVESHKQSWQCCIRVLCYYQLDIPMVMKWYHSNVNAAMVVKLWAVWYFGCLYERFEFLETAVTSTDMQGLWI